MATLGRCWAVGRRFTRGARAWRSTRGRGTDKHEVCPHFAELSLQLEDGILPGLARCSLT